VSPLPCGTRGRCGDGDHGPGCPQLCHVPTLCQREAVGGFAQGTEGQSLELGCQRGEDGARGWEGEEGPRSLRDPQSPGFHGQGRTRRGPRTRRAALPMAMRPLTAMTEQVQERRSRRLRSRCGWDRILLPAGPRGSRWLCRVPFRPQPAGPTAATRADTGRLDFNQTGLKLSSSVVARRHSLRQPSPGRAAG